MMIGLILQSIYTTRAKNVNLTRLCKWNAMYYLRDARYAYLKFQLDTNIALLRIWNVNETC